MQNTNEIYIDKIIDIIEANQHFIEYDYKGKENQILIAKELIDKIDIYIQTIADEKINLKNLAKNAIRNGFELSATDIVISKNGSIFIKLVDKIDKIEVAQKDKDTALNRYNGFSEDEMKSFYNEFFQGSENKNFFPGIAKYFVNKYFNEKKITNDIYEKNVFKYIHSITLEHLASMYDNSDGFFQGFAGYVFRIHFKEVFEYVADSMLDEISMANKHMIDFLNYYSSSIIVVGGNKYKVPTIEGHSGLRWNVISMLSIAKIYTQTEKSIKVLRHNVFKMKTEVSALYIDDMTPVEYHTAFIKTRQKLETKIITTKQVLDKYLDSLRITKDQEERISLENEIEKFENFIERLREKKNELSNRMIKQSTIKKYQELQNEMDILIRELTAKQKIITQNRDSYQSMRNSLVKALTSKKEKL